MKKLFWIFIGFSILFISSCKDDGVTPSNDSILTKANIAGYVSLYDEFGSAVTNERMMVYMESDQGNYWAETEKDGTFLVPDVAYYHNYTIVYEKDDFGTFKKFGYNHEYTGQAGEISSVKLSKKSTSYCTGLIVSQSNDSTHFHLFVEGGSYNGMRRFRLLFHTIPEISNEIFSRFTGKFTTVNSQSIISLSKEDLLAIGLESGVTYYVQAYGDSYYSNSYFDEENIREVLPNLGYKEGEAVPTGLFVMP